MVYKGMQAGELAPAAALAAFADLSLAVHRLKLLAHAKFFTRP